MSNQPKPTKDEQTTAKPFHWNDALRGKMEFMTDYEWTGDDDGVLLPMHRFVGQYAKEIADAHNAALRNAQPFLDEALKQLAAERAKVKEGK